MKSQPNKSHTDNPGLYPIHRKNNLSPLRAFGLLILGVLLVTLSPLSASADEFCPKSPREDRLTFHQVMINFGRFTLAADSTTQKGSFAPSSVTDDEFKKAIAGLGKALDCTEAVLHDTTGTLVPEKLNQLPPEQRAAYHKIFIDNMQLFAASLRDYHAEYQSLHLQDPMARKFDGAVVLKERVREMARKSHDDLK